MPLSYHGRLARALCFKIEKDSSFSTDTPSARARRLIFRHIFLCPPASITYWWHYRSIDSKEYWHGSQGEQGTKAFDPQGPQADEGSHPPERAAESGGAVSYTHLRAHETGRNLVCRLLLEKKKQRRQTGRRRPGQLFSFKDTETTKIYTE